MSVNQELQEVVTRLISNRHIEGYFLSRFELAIKKSIGGFIETACMGYNNGRFFIHFSNKFWESLTPEERIAVLRHEVHHFLNYHLTRRGTREPLLWNISCDAAINQFIENLPKGGVTLPNGWEPNQTAEYYYDKLIKEAKKYSKQGKCPNCKDSGKCSKCKGKGCKQCQGSGECQSCKGKQGGQGDCPNCGGSGCEQCAHGKSFDDLRPNKNDLETGEADVQARTMVKDIVKELLNSGHDRNKLRGLAGGVLESIIKDLSRKPIVSWKVILTRFVSSFTTFDSTRTLKRPDRRDLVPWSRRKERRPKLIVAIDTSGSVSDKMLLAFFGQVRILGMTLSEVRVIGCDANVTLDVEYRPGLEKRLRATGRGGTDFEPVVKLVNKKYRDYDGMVYLTDGYCPVPSTRCKIPIIWIVDGNHDFEGKPKVNTQPIDPE